MKEKMERRGKGMTIERRKNIREMNKGDRGKEIKIQTEKGKTTERLFLFVLSHRITVTLGTCMSHHENVGRVGDLAFRICANLTKDEP
jgi:hypothetical protein